MATQYELPRARHNNVIPTEGPARLIPSAQRTGRPAVEESLFVFDLFRAENPQPPAPHLI